jgi:hypothetical protein
MTQSLCTLLTTRLFLFHAESHRAFDPLRRLRARSRGRYRARISTSFLLLPLGHSYYKPLIRFRRSFSPSRVKCDALRTSARCAPAKGSRLPSADAVLSIRVLVQVETDCLARFSLPLVEAIQPVRPQFQGRCHMQQVGSPRSKSRGCLAAQFTRTAEN